MQPLPQLQQMPNPLEQLGQVAQLRSLLDESRLRQQQLQALQQQAAYQGQLRPLELQSRQLDVQSQQAALKSQQALQQALMADPHADPDDLLQAAMKGGARPMDLMPTINGLKESAFKTGQLRGQALDNAQKLSDAYGQQSQMLLGIADPAQRQAAYSSVTIPEMLRLGIPQSQIEAQVPNEQDLRIHVAQAMRVDQQLDQARKQQTFEIEHGPLPADRIQQLNASLGQRYQVLNPGQQPPANFQLPSNGTQDDFTRIDKLMQQTEQAQGTKAQRDQSAASARSRWRWPTLRHRKRLRSLTSLRPTSSAAWTWLPTCRRTLTRLRTL
jgi:hypothetical protein